MVKITFKPTNEEIFEIDFDTTQVKTVGDMKNVVAQRVKETTDRIKFIFKGKWEFMQGKFSRTNRTSRILTLVLRRPSTLW